MPNDPHDNPYEAIPVQDADPAAPPTPLTFPEYAAAFFAALMLSVVTLFVSCAGMFTAGQSIDRGLGTYRDNSWLLVFVLFLCVGVPILVTVLVGSYTFKTVVKSMRPTSKPASDRLPGDSPDVAEPELRHDAE